MTKERIRPDRRAFDEIRAISIETSVLPRTHGSALFTRGETQALVTATLGTMDDSQRLESYEGEKKKSFMLHYNFPPFSVGETGRMTGVGRREVGHGALAERAITAVLPGADESPYSIRIVSDILESNGSSSMASVCGASLALFDAGIKLKGAVAGVAMGLVKEGDDYAILTDIAGAEDHYGDMDFKVAGTRKGLSLIHIWFWPPLWPLPIPGRELTSFPSRWITASTPTPAGAFPAALSSAKAAPAKKRF